MVTVIIPIILLIGIILIKKIPYIGGNVMIALFTAGISALITGGIFNPLDWGIAWINGVDIIIWVIALSIFGSIYAEAQTEMGALDTVLNTLRARLGHSPRGLVIATLVALSIAGSLLGSAVATAAVIGILVIRSLDDIGISPVKISAIIVIGASFGSIMPPISQATFLSASLVGIDPLPVTQIAYFTIGLGLVFCSLIISYFYIDKNLSVPKELLPKETASRILASRWTTLVPLMVLIIIILLNNIPVYNIDIISFALNKISIGQIPLLEWVSEITLLKGLSNQIVLALIFATLFTFLYPSIRKKTPKILFGGLKNIKTSVGIQISAGFMLGAFYAGGQIEFIKNFAINLQPDALKIGGGGALTLMGMLTGSQSTAQTSIFSFFGPALEATGLDPVNIAIAGSHLAASGQGLPPADITTFMVAGLVGGILGVEVDPIKSMFYSSIVGIYLLVVGFIFLYI